MKRERSDGTDDVADADQAFGQDLGAEPAAMEEPAHQPGPRGQLLEVLARLAETRAAHAHAADQEHAVDEVIERDARRCDVATSLGRGELDPQPLAGGVDDAVLERLDRLHLDQRDLTAAGAGPRGVMAGAERVTVTFEASSGKRADLRQRDHGRRRRGRDVDRQHAALPHGAKYIRYDPAA